LRRQLAVAFTGPSGSGKTTLIEKIASQLSGDRKVVVIKHDPKEKAVFDTPGKDSYRFYATGADVIVASPSRTAFFSHQERTLEELAAMAGAFDLLMVEGLKTWPLPRIAVFRNAIDESYLPYSQALAVDGSIAPNMLPSTHDILDLNDIDAVIAWIDNHAVTLKG
jgi:molybdopterin-guanine dinucleotide biosynthesis protein B